MHHIKQLAANDTILMDAYIKLGSFYDDVNLDSAVYYANKGIAIARKLGLRMYEAEILMNSSFPLAKMGNYPRALKELNLAVQILEDPSCKKIIWGGGSTLGSSGKTPEMYRLLLLGYTYMAIDNLYFYTGDFEKQIAAANKAKNFALAVKDTLLLAQAFNDLGVGYGSLNKLDSAIFFQKQALALYAKLPFSDRKYEGIPYSIMGESYQKMGKPGLAKENFEKALQVNLLQNNTARTGDAYLQLGDFLRSINKTDSSLICYKKAAEAFNITGKEKWKAVAYRRISDYYAATNNRDSSFNYLRLATTLHDKLDSLEKNKLHQFQVAGFNEQLRLQAAEKERMESAARKRIYSLIAAIAVFMLIAFLLFRISRNRKKANIILETQKNELQQALTKLHTTQSQLIQSEKMASLGELTAGIAHEIQNPLNFVNNFSEVSAELVDEMNEELQKGDISEAKTIAFAIRDNLSKINHHGKRADAIVKNMLQHSRKTSGKKEAVDINAYLDEFLRLTYHGFRAKDNNFNATLETNFDPAVGKINVAGQDIGRVFLNVFNNAFYACAERSRTVINENKTAAGVYEPIVQVTTLKKNDGIEIKVKDNGIGIPGKVVNKIFQPFFTTKPAGEGTGLGLSLSYDIIKSQGGEMQVETKEGEGSTFIIALPFNK